jgi:hypothetical protein
MWDDSGGGHGGDNGDLITHLSASLDYKFIQADK